LADDSRLAVPVPEDISRGGSVSLTSVFLVPTPCSSVLLMCKQVAAMLAELKWRGIRPC
jgi:hypothetical protein